MRSFNHPKFAANNLYINNDTDSKNDDFADKILRRSNFRKYVDKIETKDEDKALIEFFENKTEEDLLAPSDDITEDELDQAFFEATYSKPVRETDEFKSILL